MTLVQENTKDKMKNISGYVCVFKVAGKYYEYLIGKKIPFTHSQDILSNGLVPYKQGAAARNERDKLVKYKYAVYAQLAKLDLNIAESQGEIDSFGKSKSIILVHNDAEIDCNSYQLYGPVVNRERPFHDARQRLGENGFHGFDSFKNADDAAHELFRQAGSNVTLAEFRLERLEELVKGPAYTETF